MAIKGPTTDHMEIRNWAESKGIVPANLEPNRVDAEPATMTLLNKKTVIQTQFAKEMSWDDFFARFDCLGLTLVYDDSTAFNEILQIEEKSNYVPAAYRAVTPHH